MSIFGSDLLDGKPLSDYNIQRSDTIDVRFVGQLELYVQTMDEARTNTAYIVNVSDKLKSLKAKIQDKQG